MTGLSLVTGPVYAITPVKVSQQTQRLCSEKPKSVKFRVNYELLVQIPAEISVSPATGKNRRLVVLGAPATQIQIKK